MIATQKTVFIVDDDIAIRDALTLMIRQEGLAVEAFDSAKAFLASCRADYSGCIIIDINMQEMDGMQLHQELIKRGIMLSVIFLTGYGDIPMSVRAIKAGAVDFMTKPFTREMLLANVQYALAENEKINAQIRQVHEYQSSLQRLTDRELQVMALAIEGQPNKEVARRLGISHRTVEIYKSNIMHKTGATNLIDLARIARISGLEK